MSIPSPRSPRTTDARTEYARFLALVTAILAGLVALGVVPTERLGGAGALTAMAAALAVCLFASLVGSVPVVGRRGAPPSEAMPAMLGSIALRLAAVLFVGGLVAFSGLVAPAPFLLWLAIGHAALLVPDTLFALGVGRGTPRPVPAASET